MGITMTESVSAISNKRGERGFAKSDCSNNGVSDHVRKFSVQDQPCGI